MANAHSGAAREPRLVYLYGPPAAGKLTIAEKVRQLTGFRLFHNHLTVNAIREVFDFGTPEFGEVVDRIRLDVFRTAMDAGVNLIFTNNSAWSGPHGAQRFVEFTQRSVAAVEAGGGRVLFVRVTAPVAVLEARLADDSRRAHGKLLDPVRLRELLDAIGEPVVPQTALTIDTSRVSAAEAAELVASAANIEDRSAGQR